MCRRHSTIGRDLTIAIELDETRSRISALEKENQNLKEEVAIAKLACRGEDRIMMLVNALHGSSS